MVGLKASTCCHMPKESPTFGITSISSPRTEIFKSQSTSSNLANLVLVRFAGRSTHVAALQRCNSHVASFQLQLLTSLHCWCGHMAKLSLDHSLVFVWPRSHVAKLPLNHSLLLVWPRVHVTRSQESIAPPNSLSLSASCHLPTIKFQNGTKSIGPAIMSIKVQICVCRDVRHVVFSVACTVLLTVFNCPTVHITAKSKKYVIFI